MKKILYLLMIASVGILFAGFRSITTTLEEFNSSASIEIPDDVMSVIKNSCFGCHNSESRNVDAKEDLSFDKLDSLKPFALAGLLENIKEELEKDKMPPPKFLKKYPDRALTKENKLILLNWVKESEAKLESK